MRLLCETGVKRGDLIVRKMRNPGAQHLLFPWRVRKVYGVEDNATETYAAFGHDV